MSNLLHWQYFSSLEDDLEHSARYVHVAQDNMNTHSIEFMRIILMAGSEVDALCKALAERHHLGEIANIGKAREAIHSFLPFIADMKVYLPRYNLEPVQPWKTWNEGKAPDWWNAYTNLKHNRHSHFGKANLRNVIDCMAGLFVILCHVCAKELLQKHVIPRNFMIDECYYVGVRNLSPGYKLPDYDKLTSTN